MTESLKNGSSPIRSDQWWLRIEMVRQWVSLVTKMLSLTSALVPRFLSSRLDKVCDDVDGSLSPARSQLLAFADRSTPTGNDIKRLLYASVLGQER